MFTRIGDSMKHEELMSGLKVRLSGELEDRGWTNVSSRQLLARSVELVEVGPELAAPEAPESPDLTPAIALG